jgi:C1A family cysteine protease
MRVTFTLLASLLLCACSQTPVINAAALQGNDVGAFAKQTEARIVQTEIGPISVGLLPVASMPKGMKEDLPTSSFDEIGMPGFDAMAAAPKKADLRPYFSPVRNQGQVGSCSAFATTGLMEAMLNIKGAKAAGHKVEHLAPLFFYYAERKYMEDAGDYPHATKKDTGCWLNVAARTAQKYGAPLEENAPYRDTVKAALAYDATPAQFALAEQFRFAKRTNVQTLQGMKKAIASKHPFVFPVMLYQSFMTRTVARTGEMPMPLKGEEIVGGHAVVGVGYDDEKQAFLIRNSWGQDWGQGGYFWMPYDFFKTQYVGARAYGDCWTLE